MKALLDTHVFLWWGLDDPRLSKSAHDFIEWGENQLVLSVASGWEMAIKFRLGKLNLPRPLELFVHEKLSILPIVILPIQMRHALHVSTLPDHHADPFDRLLVAQSQLEDLPIISADVRFLQYGVKVIW